MTPPLLHRFRHDGSPPSIRSALKLAIHTRKWCALFPKTPHSFAVMNRATDAVFILAGQLREAVR